MMPIPVCWNCGWFDLHQVPQPLFCPRCGHRVKSDLLHCDCPACVKAFVPELLDIQGGDYPEPWPDRWIGGEQ